jgi:hypothetical protein|tara:strand:+ start:137 stop:400 length:264 start_codon:yes stop_codon:yes gene_type:complete
MDNNKLIAEFMGYPNLGTKGDFSYLKYHTDWNWLMPVVEKCLEKHNNLINGRDVIDTSYSSIAQALQVVSLKETYNAVVEFIKEHNK